LVLCSSSGFTLIELVIVLALLGIVLAVTVLTAFPGSDKALHHEADRLAQLWTQAFDDVQLNGQTIVWEADSQGYRFLRRDGGELKLITDDPVLRPRLWPLQPLQLRGDASWSVSSAPGRWQVALERSGGGAPFRFELLYGDGRAIVRGDGLGNFRAEP
jgi:general secretion pathway protein H